MTAIERMLPCPLCRSSEHLNLNCDMDYCSIGCEWCGLQYHGRFISERELIDVWNALARTDGQLREDLKASNIQWRNWERLNHEKAKQLNIVSHERDDLRLMLDEIDDILSTEVMDLKGKIIRVLRKNR